MASSCGTENPNAPDSRSREETNPSAVNANPGQNDTPSTLSCPPFAPTPARSQASDTEGTTTEKREGRQPKAGPKEPGGHERARPCGKRPKTTANGRTRRILPGSGRKKSAPNRERPKHGPRRKRLGQLPPPHPHDTNQPRSEHPDSGGNGDGDG